MTILLPFHLIKDPQTLKNKSLRVLQEHKIDPEGFIYLSPIKNKKNIPRRVTQRFYKKIIVGVRNKK